MQTLVTARAVILNSEGHMLIVRRSSTDPLAPGTWDVPGGRREADEALEATAQREVSEEIGIQLLDPQLVFATSDMRSDASKTWLFFAAALPTDALIVLSEEHDEYKWINPAVLNEYTAYDILLRFHTYITENGLFTQAS
jgi:8-oxo-dGTP diphosphatase